MLPKNFYDEAEKPGALKHILYSDSVSKDMKTIVKFKNSFIEYLSFDEIWNKLILIKQITLENDKEYILIEDEVETISYDVKTDSWYLNTPKYIMRHKINKDIMRLNFTNLAHLDVTENHSMLDYDSINRRLIIKKPNDIIYVPGILNNFSIDSTEINNEFLLLGLWFGDGTLSKSKPYRYQYPAISSSNQLEITKYLEKHLENIKIYIKNEWDFCVNYPWLRNILILLNLEGVKSPDRIIPQKLYEILQQDYVKLISFFIGYWIADGAFNSNQTIIASSNKTVLEQLQSLLMIIGIYSHLKIDKNNRKYNGKITGDMYKLSSSLNLSIFQLLQNFEFLKDSSKTMIFKTLYYGSSSGGRGPSRTSSSFQVCKKSKYAHLFQIKPIKIISKELIKYDDYVYDWCVPENQNFIANGCLVHNTDSIFISIPVKDADKMTTAQKLEIANRESEKINEIITKYLNEYFLPKSNISTEYNSTYFKSELLMSAIMFLDVKKSYAYTIEAKKGKILDKPEVEYTGIQVVRSNAAKLTQDILRDLIENVILTDKIDVKEKLPKTSEIINLYFTKFNELVDSFDLLDISIPGKWKDADQFINGMSLFNFIMKKEIFSLGSAGNFIYCNFKNTKLFDSSKLDMSKIKGIVVPKSYDKNILINKFNEYQIQIDKTTQWETLFSKTVERVINIVKNVAQKGIS
jgi:intein/homing endonuclease